MINNTNIKVPKKYQHMIYAIEGGHGDYEIRLNEGYSFDCEDSEAHISFECSQAEVLIRIRRSIHKCRCSDCQACLADPTKTKHLWTDAPKQEIEIPEDDRSLYDMMNEVEHMLYEESISILDEEEPTYVDMHETKGIKTYTIISRKVPTDTFKLTAFNAHEFRGYKSHYSLDSKYGTFESVTTKRMAEIINELLEIPMRKLREVE